MIKGNRYAGEILFFNGLVRRLPEITRFAHEGIDQAASQVICSSR